MKFTPNGLAISLTILTISASVKLNSFDGCIILNQKKCRACYERNVLSNQKGCDKKLPSSDHCAIYQYVGKSICQICKPGYALKQASKSGLEGPYTTECVPGTIPNCVVETVNQSNGRHCSACSNGNYVVFGKRLSTSCKKVSNPVSNCLWGSSSVGGRSRCLLCENGYMARNDGRECLTQSIPGCWIVGGNGACFSCNPYDGYSINSDAKYFKGGQ